MKANPDDNTLKANPALCKHTTIETNAQIMYYMLSIMYQGRQRGGTWEAGAPPLQAEPTRKSLPEPCVWMIWIVVSAELH